MQIGVQQGSVLGPVFFLIYVNDLDDGLTCKVSKFGDDKKMPEKLFRRLTKNSFKEILIS